MKKPTLGKGTKMSIPKAAIVWFFEGWKGTECTQAPKFWYWGDYGFSHDIVDIAGARQASFFTTALVSKALSRSLYWDKYFHPSMCSGMRGQQGANIYKPSEKGKDWFNRYKANPTPQTE